MNTFAEALGVPDYVVDLSFSFRPEELRLGDRLEDMKKLCEINNIKNRLAPVDISFQQFLDDANLSEREKDMIYLSQFFHSAYSTLHITIIAGYGELNPYWADLMYSVYNKLIKYGLEKHMLRNLTVKDFNKIINKLKKTNFLT